MKESVAGTGLPLGDSGRQRLSGGPNHSLKTIKTLSYLIKALVSHGIVKGISGCNQRKTVTLRGNCAQRPLFCGVRCEFCSDGLEELRERNGSSGSPLSEGMGLTGRPPHRELGAFHSQGFH